MSFCLARPISSPGRRAPTSQFIATPSNLTDGLAYQACCQLGRLIALWKHPPAFCLLPPPRKPPEVGAHRPPPVCKSSAVRADSPVTVMIPHFCLKRSRPAYFPHLAPTFQETDGYGSVSSTKAWRKLASQITNSLLLASFASPQTSE